MTQLVLSTCVFEIDLPVSFRSRRSFSNCCFCRSLMIMMMIMIMIMIIIIIIIIN